VLWWWRACAIKDVDTEAEETSPDEVVGHDVQPYPPYPPPYPYPPAAAAADNKNIPDWATNCSRAEDEGGHCSLSLQSSMTVRRRD